MTRNFKIIIIPYSMHALHIALKLMQANIYVCVLTTTTNTIMRIIYLLEQKGLSFFKYITIYYNKIK